VLGASLAAGEYDGLDEEALAGKLTSQLYEVCRDKHLRVRVRPPGAGLRENHGGWPDGVVFWCSYLFPDARTHLNDIFEAGTGETRQFWTLAHVPGERYLDRPVYVLTSDWTFSGGEEFAYTLQAQGRAELIGETTGGGAHRAGG
jgi:hypothetical protein